MNSFFDAEFGLLSELMLFCVQCVPASVCENVKVTPTLCELSVVLEKGSKIHLILIIT